MSWDTVGLSMSCPDGLQGGKTRKNQLPKPGGKWTFWTFLSVSPGALRKWQGLSLQQEPHGTPLRVDIMPSDVLLTVFHPVNLRSRVLSLEAE